MKIAGFGAVSGARAESGSGSVSQRYRSEDQEQYLNVTDPHTAATTVVEGCRELAWSSVLPR
jgi:hypothetical protein